MLAASEPPPSWVCRAHDMVHAQRRQLAASPDKHGCSLCIISWNVQLLWPQAGAMPLRAACIAERLLALNADIVCLQECWDARSRAVLKDALRPAYRHCYAPADFAKCGLVIFSRSEPIALRIFYRFQGATGAERHLFDKGALGALILLPDAVDGTRQSVLAVVNTHTQSDFWSSGERARHAQMIEIRGLLHDLRQAARHAAFHLSGAIVCGDLNCAAGTPEAWSACKLLGFPVPRDLCDTDSSFSFPLGLWKGGRYKQLQPTKRLDYILDSSAYDDATNGDSPSSKGRLPAACTAPLPSARLMAAQAHIERACAAQLPHEARRYDTGGLLTDHAAVIGCVTCALGEDPSTTHM